MTATETHHRPHPCVARPHTGLVHRDGPCQCFVGGPAPEHDPFAGLEPLFDEPTFPDRARRAS